MQEGSKLLNKSKDYEWKELATGLKNKDGPTILWHVIEIISPTTIVGVQKLKDKLNNTSLNAYQHNVVDMLEDMETTYLKIIGEDATFDDYVYALFKALETTKNQAFLSYVSQEKREWELGRSQITSDTLIAEATKLYNNANEDKTWTKQDARDVKIMALTTEVKELKKRV